jgi:hypothetical protein
MYTCIYTHIYIYMPMYLCVVYSCFLTVFPELKHYCLLWYKHPIRFLDERLMGLFLLMQIRIIVMVVHHKTIY